MIQALKYAKLSSEQPPFTTYAAPQISQVLSCFSFFENRRANALIFAVEKRESTFSSTSLELSCEALSSRSSQNTSSVIFRLSVTGAPPILIQQFILLKRHDDVNSYYASKLLYITYASTYPRCICLNAPGSVPTI